MKSLLFALGLALCCVVQANEDQRFEDFDLSKLHKDSIVGAMATNCQKMKEMLPRMPASYVSFEQRSADEVQMTLEMATPHGCNTMRPVLKREGGVFTTTCGKGGKKTVEYINVRQNAMFTLITLSHPKGQCSIATLAGKTFPDIQESMKDFKAFVDRHGLQDEKVHALPKEGMCPRTS